MKTSQKKILITILSIFLLLTASVCLILLFMIAINNYNNSHRLQSRSDKKPTYVSVDRQGNGDSYMRFFGLPDPVKLKNSRLVYYDNDGQIIKEDFFHFIGKINYDYAKKLIFIETDNAVEVLNFNGEQQKSKKISIKDKKHLNYKNKMGDLSNIKAFYRRDQNYFVIKKVDNDFKLCKIGEKELCAKIANQNTPIALTDNHLIIYDNNRITKLDYNLKQISSEKIANEIEIYGVAYDKNNFYWLSNTQNDKLNFIKINLPKFNNINTLLINDKIFAITNSYDESSKKHTASLYEINTKGKNRMIFTSENQTFHNLQQISDQAIFFEATDVNAKDSIDREFLTYKSGDTDVQIEKVKFESKPKQSACDVFSCAYTYPGNDFFKF